MSWNPQVFAAAHESLIAEAKSLDLAKIMAVLHPIKDDLKNSSKTPPKSEASRSKLAKKIIDIDSETFEANDAFLNDAARVADELNSDEMIAAKLSFYAIGDSRRLDIAMVEAAMTLFYVRRQYILDIVRFALEVLPVSRFDTIFDPKKERVDQILDALRTVEKSLEDLKEKAKAGEFMGSDANPEFNQLSKLQRSFLVKEHESLGNILTAYLDATISKEFEPGVMSANSKTSAEAVLNHIATFDTFDSKFSAYSSALIVWFTRPNSVEFSEALWKYFHSENIKGRWKSPIWRAAVALLFYIGLEDEMLEAVRSVELDDLLEAVRHCIDEGAIEFWMSYAQDVAAQLGGYSLDKYRSIVRSRVPSLFAWQPVLGDTTFNNFKAAMVSLVSEFINKFADILKEMRLNEEDMYLAMNEVEEDAPSVSPGMDLERFLLLVAIVYRGNPEYARVFFDKNSDDGDVLHGFLVWGSSCRATLMAATFAESVASLASDKETSEEVHNFMVNGNKSATDSRLSSSNYDSSHGASSGYTHADRNNSLERVRESNSHGKSDDFSSSWSSVIDVFEYYTHTQSSSRKSFSGNDDLTYQSHAGLPYSSLGSNGAAGVPNGSNFVMPSVVSAPAQVQNQVPGLSSNAEYSVPGSIDPMHSHIPTNGLALQSTRASPMASSYEMTTDSQYSLTQPIEQLSDDTLLVLSAYMEIIARVSSQCENVKEYFKGASTLQEHQSDRNIVPALFKLLKMNQPINGPVFTVLAAFASPDMWRPLDSIMLGRFDEMLTSLQDALEFIDFSVELVKFDHISPKFNEYIDFIFKSVLPWTTLLENENKNHSATTAQVVTRRSGFATTTNTSNGLIHSVSSSSSKSSNSLGTFEVATENIRLLIQVGCLQIAKILLSRQHPNQEVFEIFFDTKVHESLFQILSTGVDAVINLNSQHPSVKAVTLGTQIVSLLLKLSKPPNFAFDKPVLYHLQIIPHLALYAGAVHTQLSLASIELLSSLDDTNEFKPCISRQSRILSILSSTSEATRIRVGLMTRSGDRQTDNSVKIALLEMLAHELIASGTPTNHMSVAHYLLGFRRSELGLESRSELDVGIGGIQSGSSLSSVTCDTLLYCLSDAEADSNLLRLCSIVLGHSCEDPLTSHMILNYSRQFNFWINTIKYESIRFGNPSEIGDAVLQHRASMLEMWNKEIQLCQKKLLLTIESHYIDELVPIVFSLVDLSQIRESAVALRCLRAWCELIPVLLIDDGQLNSKLDATFVATVMQRSIECLPVYSRQNTDFAEPVAHLLVSLFSKFQQNGVDNSTARHSQVLLHSASESLQPAQMNVPLREHLYSLFCQCLRLSLDVGSQETQQFTSNNLIENGSKIFQIACDDIINCYNDRSRYKALLFIEMSAVLAQHSKSKVIALTLLKYNFIPVFVLQVSEPTVNDLFHSFSAAGKSLADFNSNNGSKKISGSGTGLIVSQNSYPTSTSTDDDEELSDTKKQLDVDALNKYRVLRAGFSSLLPVAQSREGSADLLSSSLLALFKKSLGSFDDDLLASSLRIMISMLVSTGRDNALVVNKVKDVLEMHQKTVQDVLHRDASLSKALQGQESGLSTLARDVTIIVSLTDMKLARV